MIIPSVSKRRSVRNFKTDQIPKELILEVIKAGQFAPKAMGILGIEYLVVTNQELKEKINQILLKKSNQNFITQAPVLIFPIADTQKSVLPIQDLSVASENIFLQATELNLGSVWKNIPEEILPEIRKVLKLTDNYTLINLIPLGYNQKPSTAHEDKEFLPDKIHWLE